MQNRIEIMFSAGMLFVSHGVPERGVGNIVDCTNWPASSGISRVSHSGRNCRFTLKLQKWLGRKHVYLNFYLTPLLTGPGCFKHYLNRFKHERYPYCSLCDSVNKDAEHLFFVCTQFKNKRRDLSMLESEENWSAVCNIATIVAKKTAHRRKTA